MISPLRTTELGIVRREPVKGNPCKELEKIYVSVTIPRWIKKWLDRQPEANGLVLEKAVVQWYGAKAPKAVCDAIRAHHALVDAEKHE